jgi:hypothetical protein
VIETLVLREPEVRDLQISTRGSVQGSSRHDI